MNAHMARAQQLLAAHNAAKAVAPKAKKTKVVTATTVKLTVTNNRLALAVAYPDGDVLKVSASPSATRMSLKRPEGVGAPAFDMKPIFAMISVESETESPLAQFERFKEFFANTTTLQDAAVKAKAVK